MQFYLPSPADVPAIEGVDPKQPDRKLVRHPSPDEPFCGLVFKIQADRHGDLHYVRVYSGVLKANSRVYNPGKDKKENVPQLWRVQADRRSQVESASVGDIIGIVGLRHSVTGDTLCSAQEPILLESIAFPETVISMAIEPETSTERKKLADVLEMMKRQDPTFRARENEETGQTLISGMGELHLEVIKHRLLRDFRLNVRVHKPRVSYRETIQRAVEVTGECHRNIGGQMLSAKVRIRMEPFGKGAKPVVVLVGPGGVLPEEFLAAAVEVLTEQGEGGGSLGFPLMHVKITVTRRRGPRDGLQRVGLPLRGRRRLREGPARGGHRAPGADHAAGSDRARGVRGRHRGRPPAAAGDHRPHAHPRPQHGDRGPRPAGQPVRLLQRDARPQPRPRHLHDGAAQLRPCPGRRVGEFLVGGDPLL